MELRDSPLTVLHPFMQSSMPGGWMMHKKMAELVVQTSLGQAERSVSRMQWQAKLSEEEKAQLIDC